MILALIAFRDESKFLPGCLAHLAPYVDGILCLDDGSTDDSRAIAENHPSVLTVLRQEKKAGPHFYEKENRNRLMALAQSRGADFVLCCDADERFETGFLRTISRSIRAHGNSVYNIAVRDIWDKPNFYRADGHWACKYKAVMFPIAGVNFDSPKGGTLHTPWVPSALNGLPSVTLQLNLYHLRSLRKENRRARMEKFKSIDPLGEHQSIGYDYLCDESGLELKKIPVCEEYELTKEDLERVFLENCD